MPIAINFLLLFCMSFFSGSAKSIIIHDIANDTNIRKAIFSGDRSAYEHIFQKKLYEQLANDVNQANNSVHISAGTIANLFHSALLPKLTTSFLSLSPMLAAITVGKYILEKKIANSNYFTAINMITSLGGPNPSLLPSLFNIQSTKLTGQQLAAIKKEVNEAELQVSRTYEQSLNILVHHYNKRTKI